MHYPSRSGISRRLFLQSTLATAVLPAAFTYGSNCRGPQPAPPGDLPRGPFGVTSTAMDVIEGLDLAGLNVVITGCNSGLGLESMRVLASRGAHVIGTARTAAKAEQACSSVAGKTTPMVLELGSYESIHACTDAIRGLDMPLHVVMCNAGIMALPELRLVNGLEAQFAVNHLGHFLFTNGLMPAVKAAGKARIVIVSSCAHFGAPEVGIEFDNLDGSKSYAPWKAYGQSKLANGLFAAELSRRLAGTGIIANSLHPGVIKTNLGRHLPPREDDRKDEDIYDKDIPQGAATQVYVAVHPTPRTISGHYFADCNPALASAHMYDAQLAKRLWEVSEELTG
jgi:NAD(P)-dependent dehydrogenase (short-subunit alcohol dehydrogenase family)